MRNSRTVSTFGAASTLRALTIRDSGRMPSSRSKSVIVWALSGWVKSATRAEALRPSVGQAGEAAEVGQAHRVRRREAVSREGAAVFLRRAPAPAVHTDRK